MRARLDPAAAALIRALTARDGGRLTMLDADSIPWSSATFAGARHRLTLRCEGAEDCARAARLAGELAEAEFDLPGHLVADIAAVERAGAVVRFEALTVVAA